MNKRLLVFLSWVAGLCLLFIHAISPALADEMVPVVVDLPMVDALDNRACLECHDGRKVIKVLDTSLYADPGDERPLVTTDPGRYAAGVHARMLCTECHTRMTNRKPPHQTGTPSRIDCAKCHEDRVKSRGEAVTTSVSPRIASVLRNIKNYRRSFHGRPNKDAPNFVNATCHECHDSHFFSVPTDKSSLAYADWRLTVPKRCGKCHEDQIENYAASVHGVELQDKKNAKSANCVDCHTAHEITGARWAVFKRLSPDTCAACHPQAFKTYRGTYHGQMTQLGDIRTAKCFNCHESHKTLPVEDLKSFAHPNNRLKNCQKCHDGEHRPLATAGFASFSPHAHAKDYDRYPQVWIASRFMTVLLWGVLTFFWLHAGLWCYRAWREPEKSLSVPPVDIKALGIEPTRYFCRFPPIWRVLHLLFALVVMTLILTGMTVLYAHSDWAPVVARLLGGAERVVLIHRVAAVLLVSIFLAHLVYLLQRLLRDRSFDWFGPDSLIPNRKDFTDCRDMLKWFLGQGPKPKFDRWTYYEKFDYWAVFWGIAVIGSSGVLLAFPHSVGQYLDGWVFTVAILVHGEEAFLAALFLFTVHFFNNHFRPGKLPPPDIVMFTGTQPLEVFQRDHPAQYERLLASGELEKYLVNAPSMAMTLGSKLLGGLLISVGLTLLFLVVNGYLGA